MNAEQGNIGSRLVRLAAAAVLGTGDGHLVLAMVCWDYVIGGGALGVFARTADEGEASHAGVVAEQGVGLGPRYCAEDVYLGFDHADDDPLAVDSEARDKVSCVCQHFLHLKSTALARQLISG
jgi:hypothetical protein